MSGRPAFSRVTSEKRAAAARANGAKSRGPITLQGRANSSRNSRRHGLRSQTLFMDPASLVDLADQLAGFENDFAPQSSIERNLVRIMAVAYWRQTCLRKLETALFNSEAIRLKSPTPGEAPTMLHARVFRSLSDNTCFLHIFFCLESRFERQYLSALKTLNEYRASRAECAADRISEKVDLNERTQQVTENTTAHSGLTQEVTQDDVTQDVTQAASLHGFNARRSESGGNAFSGKALIDERTKQTAENTKPDSEPRSIIGLLGTILPELALTAAERGA
jgi:hypothetical protein